MGYTQGNRWDYDLIKNYVNKLGYKLLEEFNYKNNRIKFGIMDSQGYKYYYSLMDIQKNIKRGSPFSKSIINNTNK